MEPAVSLMYDMKKIGLIFVALLVTLQALASERMTIREAMERVEKEFAVRFVYDSDMEKELGRTVFVTSFDSLENSLRQIFADTGIEWRIQRKYVVLHSGNAHRVSIPSERFAVSGYLYDGLSGETLIGAGISSGTSGAVTNNFGYYTLTLPSGYQRLTFSYIGCAPVSLDIDLQKDTVINIRLQQTARLEAARVVSGMDSGIGSTLSGSLEIPGNMIRNTPTVLGEQDLLKTVQMMPGVQGGINGFSGIYVRGGNCDENLFLLDGTPLYNVSHFFGLLSVFTPESVKKATLYKGSFPARYGGRVSSILDIRTNDGNSSGLHGSVSAGILTEKLHLEGPLGSGNTTFSASVRGMHSFVFDRVVKWAGSPFNYAFYDIDAKISHRFSDSDRVSAGFYTGRDYFRYEESDRFSERYYGPDYEPYERLTEDKTKVRLNWGNTVGTLRWTHVFGSKLFLDASAYVNRYAMVSTTSSMNWEKNADGIFEESLKYKYTSGIFDVGLRADFDFVPVPTHLVRFGAEYIRHAYRPEVDRFRQRSSYGNAAVDTSFTGRGASVLRGDEISVHIEDEIAAGEHFSLSPGFRLSLFRVGKARYLCPEPRFSAKYSFGGGYSIKAAYSRMSQYVHQLASGSISLPTDLWVPITENIRPVISHLVSLGACYGGLEGWEFSIEGYWRRMFNVLDYQDGKRTLGSALDWESNVSSGEGRTYGAELGIRKTAGRTTGALSYTLSWSERIFPDGTVNNGKWFPFVYDRRHNLALSMLQKIGQRMDLCAVWYYSSGHCTTAPDGIMAIQHPVSGTYEYVPYISSRNNYRLPGSHRLDLSLNIHKKTRRGEKIWNVGMCNVYGARNPDWVTIEKFSPDDNPDHRQYLLDIRSLLMFIPSFSYTFKF